MPLTNTGGQAAPSERRDLPTVDLRGPCPNCRKEVRWIGTYVHTSDFTGEAGNGSTSYRIICSCPLPGSEAA